jgi:beta-glucanase (GH16 family)
VAESRFLEYSYLKDFSAAWGPRLDGTQMLTSHKLLLRAALAVSVIAAFALPSVSAADQLPVSTGSQPLSAGALPMPVGQGKDWKLIFTEGFNDGALDPNVWQPNRPGGPQVNLPYNQSLEAALYDPANVSVRDGSAVLQVSHVGGDRFPFRSGVIQSSQRFNFTHGYIEARVKVSACHGCWPAFWLLEDNVDPYAPSDTEVDVFEFFSTKRLRQPYFNFHWSQFGAELQIRRYGRPKFDYTRAFHTYGLKWQPGLMRPYVDGQPGPAMVGNLVPDVPMYPIFNMAVFRGGRPRKNAKMAIDYVRAWQRP